MTLPNILQFLWTACVDGFSPWERHPFCQSSGPSFSLAQELRRGIEKIRHYQALDAINNPFYSQWVELFAFENGGLFQEKSTVKMVWHRPSRWVRQGD